jgi:hypothetical protein
VDGGGLFSILIRLPILVGVMSMTASTPDSSSTRSSDRASLLDVHEQTPLLGFDSRSAHKVPSTESPWFPEPTVDASHLLEAQSKSSLTSSAEDDREPKTAIDLAAVIPVLLLGANAPRS